MVREEMRQAVELMFRARDFHSMWGVLNGYYKSLGFTDAISDNVRIDEYRWIVQQLRKYMFSKQDQVLSQDALEGMVAEIDALISRADEYGDDRKHVVYNFVRDSWLYEVRNYIVNMMTDEEEEDE